MKTMRSEMAQRAEDIVKEFIHIPDLIGYGQKYRTF